VNGVGSRKGVPVALREVGKPDAIGVDRVAVAAHYTVARAEPGQLGHVKLNIILWYADLEHYRRAGRSLTELTEYVRTPQGPYAADIPRAVGTLVRAGKVREQPIRTGNLARRAMISLRQPSGLNPQQAGILDRVIEVIAPLSATQLLAFLRADPLWQEVAPGGRMIVSTGSIITKFPAAPGREAARFLIAAE
jgi:hypothetical protein